ncbi:glycoside hydrolase family 55 protein [Weissella confusa]|uniref:glycosyl hydrolase family 28-related protein n=1 Tax=Limosilactobacillus reuteri TaxID=1598 RepID=UPI0013009DBB|nr:glycosyl hydrolase family 28-related protein [Limosilactobacillus reuteri]MCW3764344.1 glycoside hydrolase family 55 protein [Weissella confusa]
MPVQQIKHNNDGKFYHIAIDIAKEGAQLFDLTPYVKGRVGDNNFGLLVDWYRQGMLMNVNGAYKPIIDGLVGNFSFDKNGNLKMDDDASPVYSVGKPEDCGPAGQVTYHFPEQMFPKEGIFKGYLGLIDDKGNRYSGVDIWFTVLAGNARMGIACDFYISELEKAIATAEEDLKNSKGTMQKVVDEFTSKMNDLTNRLETQATTDQAALDALEAKIKQDGLFTQAEADAFKQSIQQELDKLGDTGAYTEPGNNLIEKIINEADDHGINVRHFGATGDGQTDDTDAFQKALDYAADHNHSAVYVPAGKYVITRELTLNFICLFGEGLTSSVLLPKGQIPRLITLQWKAIVHNLRINNTQVTGPINDICLAPVSGEVGTNNIVRDVTFDDDGTHEVTAIDASPKTSAAGQTIFSFPNVIDSITMSDVYNGIHLYSSKGGWVNGNVFQNVNIQGFRNTGVWLDGGDDRVSISHNSFNNIQVQYKKDAPASARAFKINFGVNNKFSMINTWQDQGTNKAIPSMELQPLPGADSWDIRNNTFDGILESEIDGNAETLRYNDTDGLRLSYWLTPSFQNGYGSLNTTKTLAENLLPENLIVDFVQGKRSPLQWDNNYYKPTDKGIDDKGYYVKFTRVKDDADGKSAFGLPLNRISNYLRGISKYTVVIDFDINGEDNANVSFQTSSGYFHGADRTVLSKGHHQMVRLQNGVYRYYETFNNNVQSSDPMFLYAYFGGGNAINIRHFALVPGWLGPYQDIRETHNTTMWSITSPTKIDFTSSDAAVIMQNLKLSFMQGFNTNDWFDKDLVQETKRSNGSYVYTYPIYI